MKLKVMFGAALAAVLCLPRPVAAQTVPADHDAVVRHDMQCYLIATDFAEGTDPTKKNSDSTTWLYFLGKLFGKNPDIDMLAVTQSKSTLITKGNYSQLKKECAKEIFSVGQKLSAAGFAIEAESAPK